MTTTSHTPGPWRVETLTGLKPMIRTAAPATPWSPAAYLCTVTGSDADALLMAAAPELLEALEGLLALPADDGTKGTAVLRREAKRRAHAAIAKAEDRQETTMDTHATRPTPTNLIIPRPVDAYLPGLTTMQEHLGDLNSAITRSVSDGQLTFLERSELQIRLRGIKAHCEALLQILA